MINGDRYQMRSIQNKVIHKKEKCRDTELQSIEPRVGSLGHARERPISREG